MYNPQKIEEREFHYSTDAEWDRAEAREAGAQRPDLAWILTDRDVWHANPYYNGPPQPHPEDECWEEEENWGAEEEDILARPRSTLDLFI